MQIISIYLLTDERFLKEPPTTMILSLSFKPLAMTFLTSTAFFSSALAVSSWWQKRNPTQCFWSLHHFNPNRSFSGNICPPLVFSISNLDGFHICGNTTVFQFEDAKSKKIIRVSSGRTSLYERGDWVLLYCRQILCRPRDSADKPADRNLCQVTKKLSIPWES